MNAPMAFFVGIDGGGTQTTCVVGDELRVLGSASAAGCNIVRLGEEEARRNLQTAIQRACAVARISPAQVTNACVGVAGISATGVRDQLRAIIGELVPGTITVVGDMDIALEAAFGGGPGVIVIAGTGSVALGRGPDGQTARVGGWGYAISDEGSGHWIGRELVRRALRAWDDAHAAMLPSFVREVWRTQTAEEVVRIANATPPPDYAALFPSVLKSANEGDAAARAILEDAATELATMAREVIGHIWGDRALPVPVAVTGGVFSKSEIVRDRFFSILGGWEIARPVCEVVQPALGALALARQGARE